MTATRRIFFAAIVIAIDWIASITVLGGEKENRSNFFFLQSLVHFSAQRAKPDKKRDKWSYLCTRNAGGYLNAIHYVRIIPLYKSSAAQLHGDTISCPTRTSGLNTPIAMDPIHESEILTTD